MEVFPSNAAPYSICCATGSISVKSNTRVKSCPESNQRSWIGSFLMQFSRNLPINGLTAVTQQFNTTTSMGRLTLNVLLSFAQFEREVTGVQAALMTAQG